MNPQFSALNCSDTLQLIFAKLPMPDLARANCVCRIWNAVASGIVKTAFIGRWNLKDLVGEPVSGNFWRDNSIGKFAISHKIVAGDTVARLAVKYSVQVTDIKRLNNMMSDHGIYSRERLLIPISKPDVLANGVCYIELDIYAKREVAVLYLEGGPNGRLGYMSSKATSDHGKKKILDSLKRSMRVDDETAQYYLSVSNGDPRAAFTEFSSDIQWERQTGNG